VVERRGQEEVSTVPAFSALDHRMMHRALDLAALGRYTTHPNPRVGCVIAHGERIVGEGWHQKSGEAHAEALALRAAGGEARGGTAYVTLEPHSHVSRTPPCTDALIHAGVRRVVCGTLDPNPQMLGNGVRQLQAAGIDVAVGLMEPAARELNAGFESRMSRGVPRVIVKVAASLDGRVALANGKSQWITGEAARADVQRLRAEASAIVTGVATVLADDPRLTVRDPSIELRGRDVLRVVVDSSLRMPAHARMLRERGPTLIVTASRDESRASELRGTGAQVVVVGADVHGQVDLPALLRELGRHECNDVLVEAGPTLGGRFLALGLADELVVYVAPRILGPDAKAMFGLPRLDRLEDAIQFELERTETFGPDVKLVFRRTRVNAVC
jgi:diaminohydroxyphosphoribosylaminopyrimidine deaminase / 5-amino-6-(5-phosphoribosylamino)uracil reductase